MQNIADMVEKSSVAKYLADVLPAEGTHRHVLDIRHGKELLQKNL